MPDKKQGDPEWLKKGREDKKEFDDRVKKGEKAADVAKDLSERDGPRKKDGK